LEFHRRNRDGTVPCKVTVGTGSQKAVHGRNVPFNLKVSRLILGSLKQGRFHWRRRRFNKFTKY
jgi:hypothetical protein